ncbi:MAG: acireductone synthase [Gammaproteobacteria bacterium]|nr:acireductone synthase [Gammaproteobacteria bacterium]
MIKAIVTDIEGTTSSISFVHEVLFPYAREQMRQFICRSVQDGKASSHINDVRMEVGDLDMDLAAVADQLIRWIDEDKKITALKAIQGMIWEQGYQQGDFKGHMYEDAVRFLKTWHQQGIQLYVYSSGSVQAQKLLFGHTEQGDLTPLFSGYFDTRIGAKTEAGSYRAIIQQLDLAASEILFLSDIEAELDAARETGMQTRWLVRDTPVNAQATHLQVSDFSGIVLE